MFSFGIVKLVNQIRKTATAYVNTITLESKLVLVQNVSKLYRLYPRPSDRLREMLPASPPRHTDFWALRDIAFEVEKGEILSLVGLTAAAKARCCRSSAASCSPPPDAWSPAAASPRCWNWAPVSIPNSPAARTSTSMAKSWA